METRVKDWLYGIIATHPGGTKDTVVNGAYEAEDILSMYHLVSWPKDHGGAGVAPGIGKWKNVKAIFPLHNHGVNRSLLRHLSGRFILTPEDIDSIRHLFGTKVSTARDLSTRHSRADQARSPSTLPSFRPISCFLPSQPPLVSSLGFGSPSTHSPTPS